MTMAVSPDSARPTVSVIIPSYNCEKYIAQTLKGVIEQTFTDWELIVVDDASTDRTVALCQGVDPRIRVITQPNAGVCAARNRGFRASTGDFICFLDHDDYWLPEKLSRQLAWMTRRPEFGVVYSNCLYWHRVDGEFPDPPSIAPASINDVLDERFTGWVYHQFMIDSCALTSSALIRREALERFGLFDESLAYSEDWDLFLRLSRHYQFAQMNWTSTLYRQHDRQGSRIARPVDFRCELLLKAQSEWGLVGPDGTAVDADLFRRLIARYRMEYGRLHLACGSRVTGLQALFDAWRRDPLRLKYLAMLLAGAAGWRPGV
jgi:glycosyltransferase involved in cell wall biosynthesis